MNAGLNFSVLDGWWLEGYDGKSHPFAALMFNPKFQEKYREWWKAILTMPGETTGKPLTPPEGITFDGKLGLMQGVIVTPSGDVWVLGVEKSQLVETQLSALIASV